MNTDLARSNLQKKQAIKNICTELHRLYWRQIGKEPDPEILWAEAEDFVTRFGPEASLKELF
jgi:hypothetical protein